MRLAHAVNQGALHVHHDPHVQHVQGQAHGDVQEGHKAHQIDQHTQFPLISFKNGRSGTLAFLG
jgi:hypothetical protein